MQPVNAGLAIIGANSKAQCIGSLESADQATSLTITEAASGTAERLQMESRARASARSHVGKPRQLGIYEK